MHVLCPSCSAENKVKAGREIVCGKCKASLSGFVYRSYRAPLLTAISALVIGAYGSYKIDHNYFDGARFPVRLEYAIIDTCITSHRVILSTEEFKDKRSVCLCAYKETVKEVPYSDAKDNLDAFFAALKKNSYICK